MIIHTTKKELAMLRSITQHMLDAASALVSDKLKKNPHEDVSGITADIEEMKAFLRRTAPSKVHDFENDISEALNKIPRKHQVWMKSKRTAGTQGRAEAYVRSLVESVSALAGHMDSNYEDGDDDEE
jgi:hypothetical protein